MTEDLMRREITDEFVLQGIGMITSPYVDKPVGDRNNSAHRAAPKT
jgi:hypothetical protein